MAPASSTADAHSTARRFGACGLTTNLPKESAILELLRSCGSIERALYEAPTPKHSAPVIIYSGTLMLWLKAFHVIAVVTWFAGLFYLPRLYVYHADATDAISIERFEIMERRLFAHHDHRRGGQRRFRRGDADRSRPVTCTMTWLRIKLLLVLLVIAYHVLLLQADAGFRASIATRAAPSGIASSTRLPSLLLIAIVMLAVVKPVRRFARLYGSKRPRPLTVRRPPAISGHHSGYGGRPVGKHHACPDRAAPARRPAA